MKHFTFNVTGVAERQSFRSQQLNASGLQADNNLEVLQGLVTNSQARQEQRTKLLKNIPEIKLRNYAFRNQNGDRANDLTFEDVSASRGLNELSYANGAAYADLDSDGDVDLIINNIDEQASLFRNNPRQ